MPRSYSCTNALNYPTYLCGCKSVEANAVTVAGRSWHSIQMELRLEDWKGSCEVF